MPPHGEAGTRACQLLDRADGIENRPRFADTDEVRMITSGSEARIIGRCDGKTVLHHSVEAGNRVENVVDDRQRRSAFVGDAGCRMRPCNHRVTTCWRRRLGNDHDAGNRDRLALQPGRAVEHAVGRGTPRRAINLLGADDGARRTGGEFGLGGRIEGGILRFCGRREDGSDHREREHPATNQLSHRSPKARSAAQASRTDCAVEDHRFFRDQIA